ncbi:PREDICTED: uncharacterized protein LOC101314012 [Fragaria vesca subsp. vesca]
MRACANLRAPRRKLSGAILVSPDNDNTDRTNGSNSMVTGVLMSFSNTRSLKWALLNLVSNGGIVYIVHVMSNPPMDIKDTKRTVAMLLMQWFVQIRLVPTVVTVAVTSWVYGSNFNQVTIKVKIVWGDERTELLKAIKNLKIKTLVMGRRDCDLFQRMLLTRLSTFMMKNAPIPVTIISERHDFVV